MNGGCGGRVHACGRGRLLQLKLPRSQLRMVQISHGFLSNGRSYARG